VTQRRSSSGAGLQFQSRVFYSCYYAGESNEPIDSATVEYYALRQPTTQMRRKPRRHSRSSSMLDSSLLVRKHLPQISRALLEGENKEKFVAFLKDHEKQGGCMHRTRRTANSTTSAERPTCFKGSGHTQVISTEKTGISWQSISSMSD
jgi:hypothetical protein